MKPSGTGRGGEDRCEPLIQHAPEDRDVFRNLTAFPEKGIDDGKILGEKHLWAAIPLEAILCKKLL